jgi:hypothetical protein
MVIYDHEIWIRLSACGSVPIPKTNVDYFPGCWAGKKRLLLIPMNIHGGHGHIPSSHPVL